MKLILVIIILTIILFILKIIVQEYAWNYFDINMNNEYFSQRKSVIFLSKEETSQIIMSNMDNYYTRFNNDDLVARNVIDIDEYREKISQVSCDLTDKQKDLIIKIINQINNKLLDKIDASWIDNKKLKNIPWKISAINSKIYEAGLPHTRNDIIIIPKNIIKLTENFTNTLLHEKLHVYQKIYPEDFDIYLKQNKFEKYIQYSQIKTLPKKLKIAYRSNPDTDEWIYKKKGRIYTSEYINKIPKTIFDVKYIPKNSCRYEHPREKSVYDLLEKIMN